MKHCKWCNRIKQQRSMERNKGIFTSRSGLQQTQRNHRIRSEEVTVITMEIRGQVDDITLARHDRSSPTSHLNVTSFRHASCIHQTLQPFYPQCHGPWMQDKQHLKLNKVLQVHTCSAHQYSCKLTSIGPRPFSLHWSQQS